MLDYLWLQAKHKSFQGKGLKLLTPKPIFQRLPIAPAQVRAGNTSGNLFFLCTEQKRSLKK